MKTYIHMYSSFLNDYVALLTWHLRFRTQFQSGQMQSWLKRYLVRCWSSRNTTLAVFLRNILLNAATGDLCAASLRLYQVIHWKCQDVSCMQDTHLFKDIKRRLAHIWTHSNPGAATFHSHTTTSANSLNCSVLLPLLMLLHPAVLSPSNSARLGIILNKCNMDTYQRWLLSTEELIQCVLNMKKEM